MLLPSETNPSPAVSHAFVSAVSDPSPIQSEEPPMSLKFNLLKQLELETEPTEDRARGVADQVILNTVSSRDPGEPLGDEMLHLAQTTFLSNTGRVPRLVVFCGVDEENGSGSVCAGAGRAIALLGAKSVCLVDANARTSPLSQLFGVNSAIPFRENPRLFGNNACSSTATSILPLRICCLTVAERFSLFLISKCASSSYKIRLTMCSSTHRQAAFAEMRLLWGN